MFCLFGNDLFLPMRSDQRSESPLEKAIAEALETGCLVARCSLSMRARVHPPRRCGLDVVGRGRALLWRAQVAEYLRENLTCENLDKLGEQESTRLRSGMRF